MYVGPLPVEPIDRLSFISSRPAPPAAVIAFFLNPPERLFPSDIFTCLFRHKLMLAVMLLITEFVDLFAPVINPIA
jgi:hypothetical protein